VPNPVLERLVRAGSPSYTLGSMCRVEHDGHVLLVETEYRRGWGYPGGLVDRRENPDIGVRREVREEVGLEIEIVGEPVVIIDAGARLVDFLYRARLAEGVAASDAHPASVEITKVRWVPAVEAVAHVAASAVRPPNKLQYFDSHPDGGLVFFEGLGRRRRGDV